MAPPATFPDSFHSAGLAELAAPEGGFDRALFCLRHNGEAFTLADGVKRRELLGQMAAGETVELQIDFRAFQQQEGVPNRNFLKFRKKILRALAKSFTNTPFLRDHDTRDFDARAGTITKSKAVSIDGGLAFDMTADVTAPFAVEALLRGLLDRFSIGWFHGGFDTILCSHCETPIFTECSHWPGDKVEDEKGRQDVIEFVFTEAEGKETSAVTIPAVRGTEIQDVRAALSSAPQFAADNRVNEETMNFKK